MQSGKKSANDDQVEKNSSPSSDKTKQENQNVESSMLENKRGQDRPDYQQTNTKDTETQKQSIRILNLQKKVTRQVGNGWHDIMEDCNENIQAEEIISMKIRHDKNLAEISKERPERKIKYNPHKSWMTPYL